VELYRRLGDRLGVAATLGSLTTIRVAKDELATANAYLLEALDLALEIGSYPILLETILSAVNYLRSIKQSSEAQQLCYVCLNHPASYETLRRHAAKMAKIIEDSLRSEDPPKLKSKMRIPKDLKVVVLNLHNKIRQLRQ
jgi:hypothetical protein